MHSHRPYPHIAIPSDNHRPTSDPEIYPSYALELGSASNGTPNPWDTTPKARQPTRRLSILPHKRSRTRSAVEPTPPSLSPPESQLSRSASQRQTAHEYYYGSSKSDSEHSFGDEYANRSDVTSPFSPSVILPADEVSLSFTRAITTP